MYIYNIYLLQKKSRNFCDVCISDALDITHRFRVVKGGIRRAGSFRKSQEGRAMIFL